MLRSKLFWGCVSICICVLTFLGVLIHRAKQLQEPIIIYKTVLPEKRAMPQSSEKTTVQTGNPVDKTQPVSTPLDSEVPTDSVASDPTETHFLDTDVQSEENVTPDTLEASDVPEPEEERIFGLTLAEIEEKIPVLEAEIRSNLTAAVELYTELRSTDGMAGKSPEIAAWRDETWKEVKRLFHDVADTGKILRYASYLKVVGEEPDPLLPGGWISELTKPLPMRVSYGGTPP